MKATATVTVKLEIKLSGTWGEECSVRQVQSQAIAEAENILGHVLRPGASALGPDALDAMRAKVHWVHGTIKPKVVIG